MDFVPLEIGDAWICTSPVWSDDRGSFREWFKSEELISITHSTFEVAQANISVSNKGVMRGIHYSLAPAGQAKWVTCVSGAIIDVIVDIRPTSPTFGKYKLVDLKGGDGRAVLIGNGLGHGFISLEDNSTVSYLLSSPYSPSEEYEINPMDPAIGIDWNLNLVGGAGVILSSKDANAPTLATRRAEGKLPY